MASQVWGVGGEEDKGEPFGDQRKWRRHHHCTSGPWVCKPRDGRKLPAGPKGKGWRRPGRDPQKAEANETNNMILGLQVDQNPLAEVKPLGTKTQLLWVFIRFSTQVGDTEESAGTEEALGSYLQDFSKSG